MAGLLVGSLVFGLVSDHLGRKIALFSGLGLAVSTGFLGAIMPNTPLFGLCRFMTGMATVSIFMTTFVILVEMVGPAYTTMVGIGMIMPFPVGELILGLEAYFVRDWKVSCFCSPALLCQFF